MRRGTFEKILALAESRGYLARPEHRECRARVPGWLADFGAPGGLGRCEQRLGRCLPAALAAFYALPELVVCVQALEGLGCDFFFEDVGDDLTVCRWGGVEHLGFGVHQHSGGLYAVPLGAGDNPPVVGGFED